MKNTFVTHYDDVKNFMTVFGQEVPTQVGTPSVEIMKLRMKLILEEVRELYDALLVEADEGSNVNWLNSHLAYAEDCISKLEASDFDVDIVEVADAVTDIEYINTGTAVAFGFDLDATFDEVHRSNMSKLGPDGKPMRREDGKVMKGPNYTPPDLKSVLFPVPTP